MLDRVSSMEQGQDREEIDQVRKLLFGDIQKENEKRIAALEAQLNQLRLTMERQMKVMAGENQASQARLVRALGDAVSQLGNQISALAGEAPGTVPENE